MAQSHTNFEVALLFLFRFPYTHLFAQKLVFESSEAVSVVSTFDDLVLKKDLVRGIYAYSSSFSVFMISPGGS